MRRVIFTLVLLALAIPGAASALSRAQGDGSLAVSDGNGSLVVQGHGVIFGYFAQGSLTIVDYHPDNPSSTVSVSGGLSHTDGGVTTYSGSAVRFLLPAGRYTLELIASGIDISAIGHGTVGATAGATFSTGSLTLDAGHPVPFARIAGPQSFGVKAN